MKVRARSVMSITWWVKRLAVWAALFLIPTTACTQSKKRPGNPDIHIVVTMPSLTQPLPNHDYDHVMRWRSDGVDFLPSTGTDGQINAPFCCYEATLEASYLNGATWTDEAAVDHIKIYYQGGSSLRIQVDGTGRARWFYPDDLTELTCMPNNPLERLPPALFGEVDGSSLQIDLAGGTVVETHARSAVVIFDLDETVPFCR